MQAVIFDMDGTLIDSEPLWKIAEKEVFSSVGVNVSNALSSQTATMTTREVTAFWYRHFPWEGKSIEKVENDVINLVAELISNCGIPKEGVHDILDFFGKRRFKIGLATNAPAKLIPVVLNKLNIAQHFHCTTSSQHVVEGKPHPGVYTNTLKKLGVQASNCIAFEDSLTGIISAEAAGIKNVVVPSPPEYENTKFSRANLKLRTLSAFNEAHLEWLLHGAQKDSS